jgi:hypothetical protein
MYIKGAMQINAFYYNKKKSVKLEIDNTKCFTHNCSLILILYLYQYTKDIGVTLQAAAVGICFPNIVGIHFKCTIPCTYLENVYN